MLKRSGKLILQNTQQVTPELAYKAAESNIKMIQAGVSTDAGMNRFKEIVAGIKKVAPRSDEFVYFVCRAIHAMEAANVDPVSGELTGDGFINDKGMWESPSGRVPLPYTNQNGDAFPESELLQVTGSLENGEKKYAYHSFIGRGLFVNHASDDAEKIRGIILDATWDPKTKGVDLLVACDKVAYPELARQIQAGYSNDVSMGTQVTHGVCSFCGNVAKTEDDYCDHIRTAKGSFFGGKPVYEVNFGLNFIEISVVATGADPKAKIRQVLASLNKVIKAREESLKKDDTKLADTERYVNALCAVLQKLVTAENLEERDLSSLGIDLSDISQIANTTSDTDESTMTQLQHLQQQVAGLQEQIKKIKGAQMATDRKAYFNSEGEPDSGLNTTEQDQAEFKQDYKTVRDTQDKQMVGKGMEPGSTGMHPGYGESDKAVKERLQRAKLRARLKKAKAEKDYRWIVLAGEEPILETTAGELYGDDLNEKNTDNPEMTNFQWVASADYGRNLIAAIRELGLNNVKRQIEAASSCSKKMNMDEMKDQTEEEKEDDKKKTKSEKTMKKAQMETPVEPIEAAPEPEEEETLPEEEGLEEEAATDLDIPEEEEMLEEAATELPADIATQLQGIADQIASAGEELAALISAEGELEEEAASEAEELGEEVVDTGEELVALDEGLEGMAAKEEGLEGEEAQQAAMARAKLEKAIVEAMKDAKVTHAKAVKFLTKHAKNSLKARRASRRALAQKLYDLTDEDMIAEAHPTGNTTAVPGHEIKNENGIQEVSKAVATKNPTGKLTASQKNRRLRVAKFIKAMDYETEKGRQPQEEGDTEESHGIDKLPEKMKENAKDLKDDGKLNNSVEKEAATKEKTTKAAADPEAAKYYKELYNSDSEAKEFASGLTKDYVAKKSSASAEFNKKRMHKAYQVALRQVKLGQIANSHEAVTNQVETLMEMDDKGFDAFSTAIENTAIPVKTEASSQGSLLRSASAQIPAQSKEGTPIINPRQAQIEDLSKRLADLDWSVRGRR